MAKPTFKARAVVTNQNKLPKFDDPYRHPGMPPITEDRPLHIHKQCAYLISIAETVVAQSKPPLAKLIEYEKLRRRLLKVCIEVVDEVAREENRASTSLATALHCTGSLRSCVAIGESDMDLLLKITSPDEANLIITADIARRLQKALILKGYGAKFITTSQIPVLKICTQPTEELLNALLREFKQWEMHEGPSGFPLPDIDLVELFETAIRDGWYSTEDKKVIKAFQDAVARSNGDPKDTIVCEARASLKQLPSVISRYLGPKKMFDTELPPRGIGLHCDITFSNDISRHSAQLVRCYMRCDKRLRDMVIFVKTWAQHREINRPYHGTLCSYGYVLMVLHYAVNIASPSLCPNLQHELSSVRGGAAHVPRQYQGKNIQFWRDENQIELAAERGMLTCNQETVGSLLRGFYAYYAAMPGADKPFKYKDSIISLRTKGGILSKQTKGWTSARTEVIPAVGRSQPRREVRHRYLLAIEDPLEVDLNVARCVSHFGMCALRDEFKRAHRIIQHGGLIGDLAIDLMEHGHIDVAYAGLGSDQRVDPPTEKQIGHNRTQHTSNKPHQGNSW